MRDVEQDSKCSKYKEVNINGRTIRDFRYADDTTLLSKTEEGLRNLVEAKYMMLNVKKLKLWTQTNVHKSLI